MSSETVYVVYCYYPLFRLGFASSLPKRKWVKCKDKNAAKAFVEKNVSGRKDRFFWAYVIGGIEYEEI